MVSCPPVVALAKLIQEVSNLSWFAHAFFVVIHLLSLYSGLQPCIPHHDLKHTLRHDLEPLYTPPQPSLHPTSAHSTPHLNPHSLQCCQSNDISECTHKGNIKTPRL